jgi:hypothetical protein
MSVSAGCNGDDTDREAFEWLAYLIEICGPHANDLEIAAWYAIEEARLLKLV